MVDKFYKNAMDSREIMINLRQRLKDEEDRYNKLIQEYRRASVNRVLDHIRSEYRKGRLCNLEILLCHCQNKLHGNIDGVELDLKEGEPFTKIKAEGEQKV